MHPPAPAPRPRFSHPRSLFRLYHLQSRITPAATCRRSAGALPAPFEPFLLLPSYSDSSPWALTALPPKETAPRAKPRDPLPMQAVPSLPLPAREGGRSPDGPVLPDAPGPPPLLPSSSPRRCLDHFFSLALSRTNQENCSLLHSCSLAGLPSAAWSCCTQTTFFPSPTKDVPLSLGGLLGWFSEVSKSWIGSRGGLEAASPHLQSPTQRCWMPISTSFPVVVEFVPHCWGQWDSTEDPGRPSPFPLQLPWSS